MYRVPFVGAILIVLVSLAPLSAQMPDVPGIPPRFAMVAKVDRDEGNLALAMTFSKSFCVLEQREIEVEGQTKQVTVQVCKTVVETAMQTIKLESLKVVTAGRERLGLEDALERLKPGTFVLLHRADHKFDARYLSLFAPETLIVLEPAVEPVLEGPKGAVPLSVPAGTIVPPAPGPAIPMPRVSVPAVPAAPAKPAVPAVPAPAGSS